MDSIFLKGFKDHLLNNFQSGNTRNIRYSEYMALIDFLVQKGIISDKKIRIFTVLHEYKFLFNQNTHKNKTQLIKYLAKTYELHENTVWNIVVNHFHDFEIEEL